MEKNETSEDMGKAQFILEEASLGVEDRLHQNTCMLNIQKINKEHIKPMPLLYCRRQVLSKQSEMQSRICLAIKTFSTRNMTSMESKDRWVIEPAVPHRPCITSELELYRQLHLLIARKVATQHVVSFRQPYIILQQKAHNDAAQMNRKVC